MSSAPTNRLSETAPSTPRRHDYEFTLAVALIALAVRLFVAIAWAKEPVWDGHYYHYGAQRIAEGLGYSEDVIIGGVPVWKAWAHYPVGYSGFLGFVYKLFGSGPLVAPITNAVLGTLLVVAVHRFARYYLTQNRARIAAGLTALHPGLIAYSAVVMTEPLSTLLLMVVAWVVLRFRGTWLTSVLGGLVLGLLILVRPSSLLVAPLLLLTEPGPWYRTIARAGLALGIALIVVLPWTLRNCQRMDGCAWVSTNGGWNLAIGALTETGRFQTLRARDGCPNVTGQVQQDRCWRTVGLRIISEDPIRWLGKMPAKLGQTFDHESFAVEYLREADPRAWPEQRRVAGRHLLTLFHRLLLAAATLGTLSWVFRPQVPQRTRWVQGSLLALVIGFTAYAFAVDEHPFFVLAISAAVIAAAHLPGRPQFGPPGRFLLGLVAVTSLTHAIFFGEDRYHLVLTPALCILAAGALRNPAEMLGFQRSPFTG